MQRKTPFKATQLLSGNGKIFNSSRSLTSLYPINTETKRTNVAAAHYSSFQRSSFASHASHLLFPLRSTRKFSTSTSHDPIDLVIDIPKTKTISTVKLKNGSEAVEVLVETTMISLTSLREENTIAFFELVQKCRNPQHIMFGDAKEIAQKFGLIEQGKIHDVIKDIILSAVEGDMLDMKMVDPIAEQCTPAFKR